MTSHQMPRTFGMILAACCATLVGYAEADPTSFAVFQSPDATLPIRFEYPADWQVELSRGATEPYTQVQVYGPPPLGDDMRVYLVVRTLPVKAHGGRYENVTELLSSYRQTLPADWRIEQEETAAVWGTAATRLNLTGTLRLPWEFPTARVVTVQSQRIFLEKDGRLYELAWMAGERTAPTVRAAFSHLLETLAGVPEGF